VYDFHTIEICMFCGNLYYCKAQTLPTKKQFKGTVSRDGG
jgi:hypothetical protein